MENTDIIIFKNQPVTKFLAEILRVSSEKSATSIESALDGDHVNISHMINGVMKLFATVPLDNYEDFVARVKILANIRLDTVEKQQGKFSFKFNAKDVQLEVTTLPEQSIQKVIIKFD
jgi:protein transport protein HofB